MFRKSLATSLAFMLTLVAAQAAWAGKYNPVLSYGDPAPAWKDLPGVDGKKHSLADLKNRDVVVVFFTCNSCPYAVEYEDRIIAFTKAHATGKKSRVAVVAINVNKIAEDSLPKMKARAAKRKFPFAYLFDESQEIARKFGAIRTPEFFVLNKQRKVVYMGAMDDSTDPRKVRKQHLREAVTAALEGRKPAVEETVAIGCAIRFERKRRRRRRKP